MSSQGLLQVFPQIPFFLWHGPARQGSAQHFSEEFLLPQHKSAVREASYSEKTKSEEDGHVDSGQFTLINFPEGSLTNLN